MKAERLRQLNRESYEAIAHDFDASRKHPWQELLRFTSEVKEGAAILDLGCGNGRLLKALPNVNFSYTGIDENEFLLERARANFPDREFMRASLEEVELSQNSYDTIFCIATFHHLVTRRDRERLLRQCYASLKQGGTLIVAVWNLWQWKYIRHTISHFSYKIAWNDFFVPWKLATSIIWRYYHGFTKHELRQLFSTAGFRRIELAQRDATSSQGNKKRNYIIRAVKG